MSQDVIIATGKKMPTAIMERRLNRDSPQSPCPLVHPLLK